MQEYHTAEQPEIIKPNINAITGMHHINYLLLRNTLSQSVVDENNIICYLTDFMLQIFRYGSAVC